MRSQDISNHNLDLVFHIYYGQCARRGNRISLSYNSTQTKLTQNQRKIFPIQLKSFVKLRLPVHSKYLQWKKYKERRGWYIEAWTKWPPIWLIIVALTHIPLDKMATILADNIFKIFSGMKMLELRLKFDWNLFLRVQLTISQHWFRKWLCAEQATSHYLKQCWPWLPTHICGTRRRWIKKPHRHNFNSLQPQPHHVIVDQGQ